MAEAKPVVVNRDQLPRLIATLLSKGIPGDGAVLQLIETHISWVLLTKNHAYKFKKPVDLGFVDFSTLDKRRYFCDEEIRLNSRTAADIYLEVIRISGSELDPVVDGDGATMEYAVKMRRFAAEDEITSQIAAGAVDAAQMRGFANDLAGFHENSNVYIDDGRYATPASISSRTLDNFRVVRETTRHTELTPRFDCLEKWTKDTLNDLEKTFGLRKSEGRVRECHGDLHLGNMVVLKGHVTAFDCLEFNPDLSRIDVASEIAFLLMDLLANGYTSFAREFLNAYLDASADYAALSVLKHYLVYRAMVRSKVVCLRLTQQGESVDDDPEVQKYVSLAEDIALNVRQGAIVITHGFSGSGKTWLCQQLVPHVDMIHLRSDVIRNRVQSASGEDDAGSSSGNTSSPGQGKYSKQARDSVYTAMMEITGTVVSAGYIALVDATFLSAARRSQFRDLAQRLQVPFRILDVSAPVKLLEKRIENRRRQGTDASEADIAVLRFQRSHADSLSVNERTNTITFDSASKNTQKTLHETAARIQQLGNRHCGKNRASV